ncbi:alpha/beta hydrolase [Halobacillus campisalis]|uniref:Alpha/beta hydrolase n=1 Tax=Halobacillus campisalis TaxID=435909 RepID=A0ABW2K7V4_9BACI|nr:alpha/beta hydrolase [Halobacillus campisalis]
MRNKVKATVIIVHGAFEHAGRYQHLAERLRSDGFSVILDDLLGQGKSKEEKGHIRKFDDYLHTLLQWIEQAGKQHPIFLLGHSMGGVVVIRTLQKYKPEVNGVILSSPALGILNGPSKPTVGFSKLVNFVRPSFKVSSSISPEKVTRNQEVIKNHKEDPLIIERVSVRWYLEFQKAIKNAMKQADEFPALPTLVMQAGDDLIIDHRKTYEWFNNINTDEKTYKQWPDYYHEIFNEVEWKLVYTYMLNFIDQQLLNQQKRGDQRD